MIVRVCMRDTSEVQDRLRFDISVGSDMVPRADMVFFGYLGPLAGDEYSTGVLLSADGVIDLGSGWGQDERFHKTNVLSKRMTVGEYATVWWNFDGSPVETTFVIEAVTQLSAVTPLIPLARATQHQVAEIEQIPRMRARVRKSFNILGYDNRVYRPPVGVEGDVAWLQNACVFAPDHAVAGNGARIMAVVDPDNVELILDSFGPNLDTETLEVPS